MTNQSSALSVELSEEAAAVADVGIIVLARFVEAADTFAHVDVRLIRPGETRSLWPEHYREHAEVSVPYRPSRSAISRAEEVMHDWLPRYILDQEHRILVCRYSMCLAAPRLVGSWRKFCKETGRNRSTADLRRIAAFQGVARGLLKNAQSLQGPSWSRVMPMLPKSAIDLDKVAERADGASGASNWMADAAKATLRRSV